MYKLSIRLLFISLILCNACVSSKNWPKDKYLLHKQSIKGNETVSGESLSYLLRQKPNRKIGPALPYLWAYNFGERIFKPEKVQEKIDEKSNRFNNKIEEARKAFKTKKVAKLQRKKDKKLKKLKRKQKEGNWLMRSVGEQAVFMDSTEAKRTAEEMEEYLRSKGFFQGKVNYKTKHVLRRRLSVTYFIEENEPTYFGDIKYISSDQNIDQILQKHKKDCPFKTDDPYDESKISKERTRVEKLLRDNGYLYFSRQYIEFQVDTLHFAPDTSHQSSQDSVSDAILENPTRNAHITTIINDPKNNTHQEFHINDIYFHLVSTPVGETAQDLDTLSSKETGIKYVYEGRLAPRYNKILDRRVRFKKQELYSLSKTINTQRSLGVLDLFKFVNINPDTSNRLLDMHIYTTPMDKYQITDEIGFNVIQGLPGPFINLSLKNRNTFGTAEIFENSLRFAIDGQTSFAADNSFYSSQEISFNSSLTFPKIIFPLSKRLRTRFNQYNPTTRLNLGFNYVNRPEYTRTSLAASISYQGQLGFSNYNITLSDLNVVNTTNISSAFREELESLNNQSILQSFSRALVSSVYMTYTYNNNTGNENQRSFFIRGLLEGGGLSLSLLRRSSLIENNSILGLNVFQYWRVNPSIHYYQPLGKKFHTLAFRINIGLARPFGVSNTLPYEKFFFAGGSSSIRAWQPRRLGPGSFRPNVNEDGTFDYNFEQPGEILLEGNAEYRFPIFGYVRGAVFVDVGNVWTFNEDPDRPGSQFQLNSLLKEVAVGSGFGIRFNLPFLLFRLDFGLKVYDPARRSDRRWVIRQFNPLKPFEGDLLVLNIGIGYPF